MDKKVIFFYSNHREEDSTIGITGKVKGQIKALRRMNFIVYYSAYKKDGIGIFDNDNQLIQFTALKNINSKIGHIRRRYVLLKACSDFITNSEIKFDYGYLRFHFFDRDYLKLLKSIKLKGGVNIVEAHAYPYRFHWFCKMFPIYFIDMLYTPVVKKYIDLVVAISTCQNIWGIRTVNIDNAIEIEKYKLQKKTESNKIRIITVSNETQAHAYYKVINGLADYYNHGGTEDIRLNLVGTYMKSTKDLINKLHLTDRVVFWGRLSGEKLDIVFDESDIGLGAFSYRKESESGSCIKTKEYFARGVPFINGWQEPAFDENYPYVLKCDTREESIDFFKVVEFYKRIKGNGNIANEMRDFAHSHYNWETQFELVFDAIK